MKKKLDKCPNCRKKVEGNLNYCDQCHFPLYGFTETEFVQRTRIDFPGIRMRFNKILLKILVQDIQNNIPDVKAQWFKGKPGVFVETPPSNPVQSSYEEANMVVLTRDGKKILESYQYRSGGGSIFIYENNLTESDIDLISKIFQSEGLMSPVKKRSTLKMYGKSMFFVSLSVIYVTLLSVFREYIFTFPLWPTVVLISFPVIILLMFSIYYLIELRKVEKY